MANVAASGTYPFIGPNAVNRLVILLIAIAPPALTGLGMYLAWGTSANLLYLSLFFGFQIMAGLGISIGYHRMVAHGAYKAKAPIKALFLFIAIQALQGGPASWAATHRRHHALADRPGDPHSPLDGLFHAHLGWLWKGNLVHTGPAHERLMRDPMVRFFEKTQVLWYIFTFVLPGLLAMAFGGQFWLGVLWGGAVRVFMVHHVTWSINSICHVFGTRPYESPDVARNNVVFALLGFGEGWHNNHHAFPKSAYLGHRWYQIDLGRYVLALLKPFRLVYDVYYPTREERRGMRTLRRAKVA